MVNRGTGEEGNRQRNQQQVKKVSCSPSSPVPLFPVTQFPFALLLNIVSVNPRCSGPIARLKHNILFIFARQKLDAGCNFLFG